MTNKYINRKFYKGFDKDLKCRGFQYEVGKEYEEERASLCDSGFHACENPLDTFNYYRPGESRYAEVELDEVSPERREDSKVCAKKIKISAEIGLKGLIQGAVQFIFEKTKVSKDTTTTTGNRANAATTGYRANAATTGYRANAATTGDGANAVVGHKNAIAASLGIGGKAKGVLGSHIVVAEWVHDKNYNWVKKDVKACLVDGETIKPDTYYSLVNGELVEE